MNFKIPTEIMWTLIAFVGGISKYLNLYITGRKKFKIVDLFARAIISGFSGYMFAHAMILINPEWAIVAAGVGGYIGAEALDYLINIVEDKFGITRDES